ncbi:hypothetical protein TpMuguga_04g00503 [Theileria parva strain Muguga]|uniref:Uncharacterized protein n=1 Tax=Theileria parva TaxID=5875 RepID=Q4N263_THEPA|nr:uncharacterized protein TpMuguga_04g00503 [Theileria parva strain Muguga]EAN31855.1 hypothetical protein TpMuguga_04g00503 [Theileria parva strain Muguga]|eukprot:XP_764138.1 hypothetical protein [Theileria parva strain Muguga]
MAKLTRIVKKSVLNQINKKDSTTDSTKDESYASRGKVQPTIDFSNLPTFEDVRSKKEEFEKIVSSKNKRKLLKVTKSKDFKKTHTKLNRKLNKSKILKRGYENINNFNKLNNNIKSHLNDDTKLTKTDNTKSDDNDVTPVLNINNTVMSRGKRKRELKKEAWRKKNEFKKEARRIVEQFQKEKKYGKALGNLSGMKDQMDQIEEAIRSKNEKESKRVKVRSKMSKMSKKSIVQSKRLFNFATKRI